MGGRLRQLRGNRTLAEIGHLAGVTASAIQRYEKGRIPRAEVLDRLARAFGVSVENLLHPEPQFLIVEMTAPYGADDRKDEKMVKNVLKLLNEADETTKNETRRRLQDHVDLLTAAMKTPKKRASGED